jgi:nucleoside-diphosphate kinase
MKEKTFVMVKPDGVQRGLVGEIISRFERCGIKIVALKFLSVSPEMAARHYAIHKGKPFYTRLIDYITSGPVVTMVLQGHNVIEQVRKIVGATDPVKASSGTIRGDFAQHIGKNLVHASDSRETADYEIRLWFQQEELVDYTKIDQPWLVED